MKEKQKKISEGILQGDRKEIELDNKEIEVQITLFRKGKVRVCDGFINEVWFFSSGPTRKKW